MFIKLLDKIFNLLIPVFTTKQMLLIFTLNFSNRLSHNLNLPAIDIYNMTFNIQFLHDQYCFSTANIHSHNVRVEHSFPISRLSCMPKKILIMDSYLYALSVFKNLTYFKNLTLKFL